jgi:anti-sigma factor RsiW
MNCTEIEELIDLYLDDALSEETRSRVERHILRCPDCAFRVRTLEQSIGLLREAYPSLDASPSFRERMAARLQDSLTDVLRPEPTEDIRQRSIVFPP